MALTGRQIRAAFVAGPGNVLLAADYSQIELRVMAHLSLDPVLLEAFPPQDRGKAMGFWGLGIVVATRSMSQWVLMFFMVLGGLGFGFVMPNLTIFAQQTAGREHLGIAEVGVLQLLGLRLGEQAEQVRADGRVAPVAHGLPILE